MWPTRDFHDNSRRRSAQWMVPWARVSHRGGQRLGIDCTYQVPPGLLTIFLELWRGNIDGKKTTTTVTALLGVDMLYITWCPSYNAKSRTARPQHDLRTSTYTAGLMLLVEDWYHQKSYHMNPEGTIPFTLLLYCFVAINSSLFRSPTSSIQTDPNLSFLRTGRL